MLSPAPRDVLFAMLSEPGHLTGTFALARRLRARGHRVRFLAFATLHEWIERQGFDVVPFGEPPRTDDTDASARRRGEARLASFLDLIRGGGLDERLCASGADVVVCDPFLWYVALRTLRLGLPTIGLSIILSLYPNVAVPPVTSGMLPSSRAGSPLRVRGAWSWLRLRYFFSKRVASALVGRFRSPEKLHHLIHLFKRLASSSGYPLREGRTWWFSEVGVRLPLAEIVLCPSVFQLPGAPDDGRIYAGEAIDLERSEPPIEQLELDGSKPLMLCSLGSSAEFYPQTARFFAAVVGASRLRPDWQFVLHTGEVATLRPAAELPGNLCVRRQVPQLALLARAAAMVTHGGLNSIRECIHFGVPMVVLPAARDQPGNAVRAQRLGIARTVDLATTDGRRLAALLESVMDDPAIAAGLDRVRAAIAAERGLDAAIELIESMAARRGAG